jgi:Fusaric acid resistance protein family
MTTVVDIHPTVFAGLPLSSWAFAIRIWLAVIAALYVGFWLQLEAPSSAAVTVVSLALPSRGQVMEKADFRLIKHRHAMAYGVDVFHLVSWLNQHFAPSHRRMRARALVRSEPDRHFPAVDDVKAAAIFHGD